MRGCSSMNSSLDEAGTKWEMQRWTRRSGGRQLDWGSWEINRGRWDTAVLLPSTRTVAWVARIVPQMIVSNVDFPQPFLPRRPTMSPVLHDRLTPRSRSESGVYEKNTLSTSRRGTAYTPCPIRMKSAMPAQPIVKLIAKTNHVRMVAVAPRFL